MSFREQYVVREGIMLFHFDMPFSSLFLPSWKFLFMPSCAPVLKGTILSSDFILLNEERLDDVNSTKKWSCKVKFLALHSFLSFLLLASDVD